MGYNITNINGDLAIGRNAEIGCDADIHGKARVAGSLKVEGFLDAPNIKGVVKGLFVTEEELNREYPNPRPGWCAIVLADDESGFLYLAKSRKWEKQSEEAKPFNFIVDSISVFASKGELEDERSRATDAEKQLRSGIEQEATRATEAENNIKSKALQTDTVCFSQGTRGVSLGGRSIDGKSVVDELIPVATTEMPGAMSPEDKVQILNNKKDIENTNIDIEELKTVLADGSFVVGIASLANAVKDGAVTFEMLDGKLQLSASVVDDLETANTLKPLSANQGKVLKELIDIINGTGEGSTDKKIVDAIAKLVDNAPENLNTLRDLAKWIEEHGEEFAGVVADINDIKNDALLTSSVHVSQFAEKINIGGRSLDGADTISVDIPAATTENAGVMSANDKTSIEILKYSLFDLEVEKVNNKFYDSGYLASFIDVKLGFNYDGSKYFVYFGNGLINSNAALNPDGKIHLYKDGLALLSLRPVESSPNEARVFKSDDDSVTIVLDITKLDPAYDFSLSVNSGVNLSPKCFGFTAIDIEPLEGSVEALRKSVSELQTNEQILFPYVVPSPIYNGETSSIQNYGLLSRQFIKELYIYDKSKIQNEDITSVYINLVARNNSTYGWLIWFEGTDINGNTTQSFIQAKTGGKSFDESTEIIELVYNTANGNSLCGYIVVDWSYIEDGVNINSLFKWTLTEHCLNIVYSPIIKAYIDDKTIKSSTDETIFEINENLDSINRKLNLTRETLVQDSIITQYVNSVGSLPDGMGGYGSYVYNIDGIYGVFKITAGVSNNNFVSVCRVDDANGNRITKYSLITTDISNTQLINIQEGDNVKTLYVSVSMSNNVTTKPSVVVVENSSIIDIENDIEDIQEELGNLSDKIVVFDKKRITDNDKVIDSSIVNPLKCFSESANNFGTNNTYTYWYTLFKLPAHTRCVSFEKKNTLPMNTALVVKVDSLDQFKLNGSYTRLITGGDVDTSSYGTNEVYQHKSIEFDEDTYIAVLSDSETDYTKFCYLEFWTATDATLADINNRVLELEGVGTEKPKPYEIVIPDKVYAVVGDTLQIFYDSIFNVQNLANYQVQALSDKGKAYPRYFEYIPTSSDIGETVLTFNLCEVNDCTTGVTKILTSKEVNLITVPALSNNISANVLCVGDSTTAGGAWCKELARRFYANDGTPQGLGLTSINICGRKTGVVSNKSYGWEGTGGWTWSTYVSSPVDAIRFTVKDVSSLAMGANYIASNGVIFEIVEINVTNGVGNIRCQYSWDTPNKNEIPTSGTLTKRYSTAAGDDTITYAAFESEKFSPFYVNGEVDFIDYANKYCDGIIDVIVIHLGINSMFGLKPNLASHLTSIMNTAKIFIDRFHAQFPNSKVLLITPPKCSVIGGMAANYNATQTTTEGIYNRQMFQYHKKYFEFANQPDYENWVTVVNTCGEFDTPYGYPYDEQRVNTRVSNIKERIGTNGVHPNADGYNMIADSVYRTLSGIL